MSPLPLGEGQGEGGVGTEVRTASGFEVVTPATGSAYAAGDFVMVNPLTIAISNLDGQDTDDIQAEDGGGLTVTENPRRPICFPNWRRRRLSTADYSRWTHSDYAAEDSSTSGATHGAGDLLDTKVFSNISTATYSETTYGYSANGRGQPRHRSDGDDHLYGL